MRIVLCLIVLLVPTALCAQPPRRTAPGVMMHSYGDTSYEEQFVQTPASAMKSGRIVAACVVKTQRLLVENVLQVSDKAQFQAAVRPLQPALNKCVTATSPAATQISMAFPSRVMFQLLAEAKLRQDGLPKLETLPAAATEYSAAWLAASDGDLMLDALTSCLAATQPERAEAVIWSEPSSPEEKAAFSALAPSYPVCASPTMNLQASRTTMRLALAVAIMRRVGERRSDASQNASNGKK